MKRTPWNFFFIIFLLYIRLIFGEDIDLFIDSTLKEDENNQTHYQNFSMMFLTKNPNLTLNNLFIHIISDNNLIETKILVQNNMTFKL